MLIAASIIFIAETEHEMYSHVWISGAAVFCLLCGRSEKPADVSRPPAAISCSDPGVVHNGDATYYVEASGAGKWMDVPRTDYNYFVKSDGMGPGPYVIRVTDLYGHTLIDSGVVHRENGDVPGGAQFPECP